MSSRATAESVHRASPLASLGAGALRVVSVHGLLIITLVVTGLFALHSSTFRGLLNFQTIGNIRATYALLALAAMVPLAANEFDLSIAFVAETCSILVVGFQVRSGLGWGLACLIVIVLGALVGLINGVLVTKFRVSSFIATLGVGTFLLGVNGWYTNGEQIYFGGTRGPHAITGGTLGFHGGPGGFFKLAGTVVGVPVALLIALAVGILLWIAFDYLTLGRSLYVIGSNPRVAALNGISVDRLKIFCFAVSGTISGVAGVVLGSQLEVAQLGVNSAYLLPAFAGALLGATSVRPGRVNVWGTLIATALLGITVSGLQNEGAPPYVEYLFNGGVLVVAVALAEFAARRREAVSAHHERERPAVAAASEPEAAAAGSGNAPQSAEP